MQTFSFTHKTKSAILALGAESAGNFSVYVDGQIHFSDDFGDLLLPENFARYQKELANFLREKKIKPDIILTDLHPDYQTTELGKILAKKYKAKHIQVQHHIAHIFSQILNFTTILNSKLEIRNYFYGIALDGTGYGTDGKIWGGECFKFLMTNDEFRINRIGHLENQIMIGGELAVKEPTRMIISILSKFLSKNKIYNLIKNHSRNHGRELVSNFGKIYSKTEFEILYNQLNQNFNCVETSSTGRILDAVSLLLGFCGNERKYKHEAITLLEANSTKPYKHPLPLIDRVSHIALAVAQGEMSEGQRGGYKLNTTYH
ncbi:MAG TPA: hypothetical protein DEA27_02870 [Candidatus Moranbacteria bacterium]|nr:hypothetical protein [Candidatus Moranbacteria bacterium]